MTPRLKTAIGWLAAGSLALLAATTAAEEKKKPVRPPTKQTQTMRKETFKRMEQVQTALDAKNYPAALEALNQIKAGLDKLNDFEKATLFNLYAVVYFSMDNIAKAIESYQQVLLQPNLPENARIQSLQALAQMYLMQEDYKSAIATLKQWFAVAGENQPDGHGLMAQAYYQQDNFKAAEKSLLTAIKLAKEQNIQPKENWLALLRAAYYEMKEYDKCAKVLEILVAQYPEKATYWSQLAGLYGLLNRQKEQVRVLNVAYLNGMLTTEGDLLNLARLYMLEDVPYPAVLLLKKAFKDKTIKESDANLQLQAQALALANEFQDQIPVLERLAKASNESKHYVYLGQALGELNQWADAADAFRTALKAKEISKPSAIRMQLGTALFNAGRLGEAREVFAVAAESEDVGRQASMWIRFVTSEIEKREALKAG